MTSGFRAFDKDTGKEIWTTKLPASAHATPMTFAGKKTKKQFVVIAAGGGTNTTPTFRIPWWLILCRDGFGLDGRGAPFSHKRHAGA